MLSAALHTGDRYAWRPRRAYVEPGVAIEVLLLAAPHSGAVLARVIAVPADGIRIFDRDAIVSGHETTVRTADLLCPWGEFEDVATKELAAVATQVEERARDSAEREARVSARLGVSASDPVADHYGQTGDGYSITHALEERRPLAQDNLAAAIVPYRLTAEELSLVRTALAGLPDGVVCDLSVVPEDRWGEFAHPPGSVGQAYSRARVSLGALVRDQPFRFREHVPRFVVEDFGPFVAACREAAAGHGVEIPQPFVPSVPGGESLLCGPDNGWLLVSEGWSTSGKLHDARCQHHHSDDDQPHALWELAVASDRLCLTCGGPGLLPTPALVRFLCAAGVFSARVASGSTEPVEKWQYVALLEIMADTDLHYATSGHGPRSLAGRVTEACSVSLPDTDASRAAIAFLGRILDPPAWSSSTYRYPAYGALDDTELPLARATLFNQLSLVESLLPEGLRPPRPTFAKEQWATRHSKDNYAWWPWIDDLQEASGLVSLLPVAFGLLRVRRRDGAGED